MSRTPRVHPDEYTQALTEAETPDGVFEDTVESVEAAKRLEDEEVDREVGSAVSDVEIAVVYERRPDGGLAHIATPVPIPREHG